MAWQLKKYLYHNHWTWIWPCLLPNINFQKWVATEKKNQLAMPKTVVTPLLAHWSYCSRAWSIICNGLVINLTSIQIYQFLYCYAVCCSKSRLITLITQWHSLTCTVILFEFDIFMEKDYELSWDINFTWKFGWWSFPFVTIGCSNVQVNSVPKWVMSDR